MRDSTLGCFEYNSSNLFLTPIIVKFSSFLLWYFIKVNINWKEHILLSIGNENSYICSLKFIWNPSVIKFLVKIHSYSLSINYLI